jgi:AcrR family transcriptional regulator
MAEAALRSDARRNLERVLDTALRVLGANPAASVEQVAAASGVHRSTVYRRFPTRETLVQALLERALAEMSDVVGAIAAGEPTEAKLRTFCVELMAIGERYAFLQAHYRIADLGPDPVGLVRVMRRYQRAGVLRTDLGAAWLARAFTAVGAAVFEDAELSVARPGDAGDVLARTFLDGARSRGR